jgi:hypothetical protein
MMGRHQCKQALLAILLLPHRADGQEQTSEGQWNWLAKEHSFEATIRRLSKCCNVPEPNADTMAAQHRIGRCCHPKVFKVQDIPPWQPPSHIGLDPQPTTLATCLRYMEDAQSSAQASYQQQSLV